MAIMTITNLDGSNPYTVQAIPGCVPETTIAASGNATFGVSLADLQARGPIEGDPAWKRLDELVKKGYVSIAFAADAADVNVLDELNEL